MLFWCLEVIFRSKVKFKTYSLHQIRSNIGFMDIQYHFMCLGMGPLMRFHNTMNIITMIKEHLEVNFILGPTVKARVI